jgi:hypothetical protein
VSQAVQVCLISKILRKQILRKQILRKQRRFKATVWKRLLISANIEICWVVFS